MCFTRSSNKFPTDRQWTHPGLITRKHFDVIIDVITSNCQFLIYSLTHPLPPSNIPFTLGMLLFCYLVGPCSTMLRGKIWASIDASSQFPQVGCSSPPGISRCNLGCLSAGCVLFNVHYMLCNALHLVRE